MMQEKKASGKEHLKNDVPIWVSYISVQCWLPSLEFKVFGPENLAFTDLIPKSISLYMRHMDPLNFGKYAEDCINIIEETMELPTDLCLVQQIRLMQIGSEIKYSLPRDPLGAMAPFSCPLELVLSTMKNKLLAFHAKIPSNLQQNRKMPPISSKLTSNPRSQIQDSKLRYQTKIPPKLTA
jgi:hypothetical protein